MRLLRRSALEKDGSTGFTHFNDEELEAMRQDAAFQVGAQLLLDITRQLVLGRARALQEGLQMLGEELSCSGAGSSGTRF